jgi:hypothetical protein
MRGVIYVYWQDCSTVATPHPSGDHKGTSPIHPTSPFIPTKWERGCLKSKKEGLSFQRILIQPKGEPSLFDVGGFNAPREGPRASLLYV